MAGIKIKNFKVILNTVVLMVCLMFSVSVSFAASGINKQIPYQGVLKTSNGVKAADGNYDMVFKIYDASSGGTVLWTGTHTTANGNAVTVTDGVFSVLLGSGSGNALALDFNTDTLYLGVKVGTDSEMTPRKRIGAAGYAFNADKLNGQSASYYVDTAGNQFIGGNKTFTGSSVFATTSFSGITTGSILFAGTGGLVLQDNANFFWDDTNNRLGIGTTTPGAVLDIATNVAWPNPALRIIAGSADPSLAFTNTTANGRDWRIISAGTGSGVPGALRFYDNTAATDRLVVNSSGDVGIGTANPSNRLTVYSGGNGFPVYADSAGGNTRIAVNNAANAGYAYFIGGANTWSAAAYQQNTGNYDYILWNEQTNSGTLYADGANNRIGIGTVAPARMLHVVTTANEPPARLEDSNGYCEINPTNTSWSCTSDKRLKTNIMTLDSALAGMLALNPVNFDWKSQAGEGGYGKRGSHIGFIAQEVEKIFPELVSVDEKGTKSVAYGSFTPIIIKAIQELSAKVDALASATAHTVKTATEYFDKIFAREYCAVADDGETYCLTGEDIKEIQKSKISARGGSASGGKNQNEKIVNGAVKEEAVENQAQDETIKETTGLHLNAESNNVEILPPDVQPVPEKIDSIIEQPEPIPENAGR